MPGAKQFIGSFSKNSSPVVFEPNLNIDNEYDLLEKNFQGKIINKSIINKIPIQNDNSYPITLKLRTTIGNITFLSAVMPIQSRGATQSTQDEP